MKEQKMKFAMGDSALLGITAIICIFLIVLIAINDGVQGPKSSDYAGQASLISSGSSCKLIVGQTASYDNNVMAITLYVNDKAYYKNHVIIIEGINENGCNIDVDGSSDYLAIGQIQRVGQLYFTVKDILN